MSGERFCIGCGAAKDPAETHCRWHPGEPASCRVCGGECVFRDGPGYYLPPEPELREEGTTVRKEHS